LRGQLIVTRDHLIADRDQLIVIGWYSRPGILKTSADSQQRSFGGVVSRSSTKIS
jgi:hypothetical protein